MKGLITRVLVAVILFFVTTGGLVYAAAQTSPVKIKVALAKTVFVVGDPVEGVVEIEQMYAAFIPATFQITLIHDDKVAGRVTMNMKRVPSGRMRFSFRKFGIPQFNTGPDAIGAWVIKIVQKDVSNAFAREVKLKVVAGNEQ